MAAPFEIIGEQISLEAAADHSSNQYKFVDVNSAGKCALAGTSGQLCIGVLKNAPASGAQALIQTSGISRVKANEAIAAGDVVRTNNAGLAEVADTAGDNILGVAITAAGAQNDVIAVALGHRGHVPA